MKKSLILILVFFSGVFFYSCNKENNADLSDGENKGISRENAVEKKTAPPGGQSREVPPLDVSTYEAVDLSGSDAFTYSLENLGDGSAKYFLYNGGNGEVRFFILKSSDGVARAAFDTCDVCFKWKLGYYQAGDLMICRRCGQQFPSVKINEIKGGCNPAPLRRSVSDGNIVIAKKDIEEGAFYFR